MTNNSIYQAFERMWQHVLVAIESHSGSGSIVEEGILTEKIQANATAMADISAPQVRDITLHEEDIEAGSASPYPTGTVHFVLESE